MPTLKIPRAVMLFNANGGLIVEVTPVRSIALASKFQRAKNAGKEAW